MDYIDYLRNIGKIMQFKSDTLHKKLRSMPKGSLQVVNDKGYIRINQVYYVDGKEKRIGIKRNPDLVSSLVSKAYYKEYIRRLDHNIKVIRNAEVNFLPINDELMLKAMPTNYELIHDKCSIKNTSSQMHPVFSNAIPILKASRYIPEDEQEKWASKPYRANSFNKGFNSYITTEGIKVRSKSEVAIMEIYRKLGYAIHYDELLYFNGVLKSPDFVAMRYDGKVIIHEHCGRVNDIEYMKAHEEKIALYKSCNFVPWDNLIVTYDLIDGTIDLELIEAEIYAKLK